MANTTKTRKYKWGTLRISCDMAQASSPIRYGYGDEQGTPHLTPFQVADAGHKWPAAFALVNRWLASEGK